jgi:hypothetical protein
MPHHKTRPRSGPPRARAQLPAVALRREQNAFKSSIDSSSKSVKCCQTGSDQGEKDREALLDGYFFTGSKTGD